MRRSVVLFLVLLTGAALVGCRMAGTSGPAGEDVLFSESFTPGEGGSWRIEGDQSSWSTLTDGQLVINVAESNTVHYATLDGEFFGDFVLEVDATLIQGDPAGGYGVLFRINGPAQFYRFVLTGNGFYTVERHDGQGNWTRLTNQWEETPAINQGLGVTNRLRVSAIGDNLTFAINGNDVTALTDSGYRQGAVGLDAGTYAFPGVQVAFDNLLIMRP